MRTRTADARPGRPTLWVVTSAGRELGLIEKYRDTQTETHPAKAFAGIGPQARYLGAWYGPGMFEAAQAAIERTAGVDPVGVDADAWRFCAKCGIKIFGLDGFEASGYVYCLQCTTLPCSV